MFIHQLQNNLAKFWKIRKLKFDASKRSKSDPRHHWIFDEFMPFIGEVPTSFHVTYIGDRVRVDTVDWDGVRPSPKVDTGLPVFDEEYFEWIDILEAVKHADKKFTMLELGAGYGRWSARAALAAKQLGKDYEFGLAEADPKHLKLLKLHMEDNGISDDQYSIYAGAVSDKNEDCMFQVRLPDSEMSKSRDWFGQSIGTPNINELKPIDELHYGVPKMQTLNGTEYIRIRKLLLSDILSDYHYIDIIDMDVQGEEDRVVEESIESLTQKVFKLHLGTHGHPIEENLRVILDKHGWMCLRDYPYAQTNKTEFGNITFVDGVQSWVNMNML